MTGLLLAVGLAIPALLFVGVLMSAGGGVTGAVPVLLLAPTGLAFIVTPWVLARRHWPAGALRPKWALWIDLVPASALLGFCAWLATVVAEIEYPARLRAPGFYLTGGTVFAILLLTKLGLELFAASAVRARIRVALAGALCALSPLFASRCAEWLPGVLTPFQSGAETFPLGGLLLFPTMGWVVAGGVVGGAMLHWDGAANALRWSARGIALLAGAYLAVILFIGWQRAQTLLALEEHLYTVSVDCKEVPWPLAAPDNMSPDAIPKSYEVTVEAREGVMLTYSMGWRDSFLSVADPQGHEFLLFGIGWEAKVELCADLQAGMMVAILSERFGAPSRVLFGLARKSDGWHPQRYSDELDLQSSSAPRPWLEHGLISLILAASMAVAGFFARRRARANRGSDAAQVEPRPQEVRQEHLVELHHHLLVIAVLAWGIAPLAAAASLGLLF